MTEQEQTDQNFMKLALEQGQLAYDAGEVPVGAVVVLDGDSGRWRAYRGLDGANLEHVHAGHAALGLGTASRRRVAAEAREDVGEPTANVLAGGAAILDVAAQMAHGLGVVEARHRVLETSIDLGNDIWVVRQRR
mgnify:CR=1 FL=1